MMRKIIRPGDGNALRFKNMDKPIKIPLSQIDQFSGKRCRTLASEEVMALVRHGGGQRHVLLGNHGSVNSPDDHFFQKVPFRIAGYSRDFCCHRQFKQ